MALVRMNISASEEVRDWYKIQAEEHGMSMSAMMSFVLTQYKKNEDARQLLKELNDTSKGIDASQMVGEMQELMRIINAHEKIDIKSTME